MLIVILTVIFCAASQNDTIERCVSTDVMECIWEFEFRMCRHFLQRKKECEGFSYCLSFCVITDKNEQYQYIRHAGAGRHPSWLAGAVTMRSCPTLRWDILTGDDIKNLRHPSYLAKAYGKDMKAVQEAWKKMIANVNAHTSVILPEAFFIAETEEDHAMTFVHNVNVQDVVSKVNQSRGDASIHRKFLDALDPGMRIRGIETELEFLNHIPCFRPCKFTSSKHNVRLSVQHFVESPRFMILHGHSVTSVMDTILELNRPVPSSQNCRKRRRVPHSPSESVAKKVSEQICDITNHC